MLSEAQTPVQRGFTYDKSYLGYVRQYGLEHVEAIDDAAITAAEQFKAISTDQVPFLCLHGVLPVDDVFTRFWFLGLFAGEMGDDLIMNCQTTIGGRVLSEPQTGMPQRNFEE